jgi:hypothetical protein
METIVVLGADRVGKTTAVKNTREMLEGYGSLVTIAHFGAVSPKSHSPVQQFTDFIGTYDNSACDFLFFDRFVSDTLFYEPYRYQLPPIPDAYASEVESMLMAASSRIDVVLISHAWNDGMVKRHTEEILAKDRGCTGYWVNAQLQKLKAEHEAYYEFTTNYLKNTSIIPQSSIHYLDGDLYGDDITLSYCDGLQLP